MKTLTQVTSGQLKQITRVGQDAVEKAITDFGLDKDGAQRVHEHGGEFAEAIRLAVVASLENLSVADKYKGEEVRVAYGYPKEYKGPKPIEEQIKAIAEIFNLDPAEALEYAKNLPALPSGAEGWFAVPSVDAVANKHFPEVTDSAEEYCKVLELVHQKLAKSRSFYNYRDGEIDTDHVRVSTRTLEAMQKIVEEQKGDILIIAAQLGKRHGGRSVRRAREVFVSNEYGLTSVAVGSIALVHPERFVRWEELDMDCAGDEWSPSADGDFSESPCFRFVGSLVWFATYYVSHAHAYYGSASGFSPQQQ